MKKWPEQALAAYKKAVADCPKSEALRRLNGRSDTTVNEKKSFDDLIEKVNHIFQDAYPRIEWPVNGPKEPQDDVLNRWWLLFFTGLAHAVDIYSPCSKKAVTSLLSEYESYLVLACKQAGALAKTVELIRQKRLQIEKLRECPYSSGDLDPFKWFLNALESEGLSFANPVQETIDQAVALVRSTQRYDNGRYWPSPETVLTELAGNMGESLKAVQDVHRAGGVEALVWALASEPEFGCWCVDTSYPWHLPRRFFLSPYFTTGDMAELIHVAEGLPFRDAKKMKSTIKQISEVKRKLAAEMPIFEEPPFVFKF